MRPVPRWVLMVAAALALGTGIARAEEPKKAPHPVRPALQTLRTSRPPSFFATVLAPSIDSRLHGDSSAALDFTNRSANPWTHDPAALARVQQNTIRATTGAMKTYAIERLGIDQWSIPLTGGLGGGLAALRNDTGGPRLRFGFSHLAPRAEVLLPTMDGRVGVNVDALGHFGASYETRSSRLRVGASVDPFGHAATFGLTTRF